MIYHNRWSSYLSFHWRFQQENAVIFFFYLMNARNVKRNSNSDPHKSLLFYQERYLHSIKPHTDHSSDGR